MGFSLKPLHYRDPALPPLKAIRMYNVQSLAIFLRRACMRIIVLDLSDISRGGAEGSAL